jgi:hypothetical protein
VREYHSRWQLRAFTASRPVILALPETVDFGAFADPILAEHLKSGHLRVERFGKRELLEAVFEYRAYHGVIRSATLFGRR